MMMIGLPTKSITKQEDKQIQQVWHCYPKVDTRMVLHKTCAHISVASLAVYPSQTLCFLKSVDCTR
jgi:hypothetical protein